MTAVVSVAFRDRVTWRLYAVGDEYEGTEGRVSELSAAGLVRRPDNDEPGVRLDLLTVAQLRDECARRGIEARRKATKAQLIELLSV